MGSSTPDALWGARSVRLLHPAAVACREIRARSHGRWILDGITLSIPPGTRLLVVSRPDGGGSLLLRILAGLARPRAGLVELAGLTDPSEAGWARRVAYVGPHSGIYAWMTPRKTLRLAARLADLPSRDVPARITEIAEALGFSSALDRSIASGGHPLEERVALGAALLTDPEVVLLDQPLRGIDPDERTRLLALGGTRRTVLLASRYPAGEAGLCTHVVLLRDGRVALLAPIGRLESAGLPLTLRGIEALASMTGPGAEAPPPAPIPNVVVAHRTPG